VSQENSMQFSLHLSATDGTPTDPAELAELVSTLRSTLAQVAPAHVEPLSVNVAPPEGARTFELLTALAIIVNVGQTVESLEKIVGAIRRVFVWYSQRRRNMRLKIAGIDVDLTHEAEIRPVVAALLAQSAPRGRGTRHALIVSNARYDDPALTALRAPVHDADALARVLGDPSIGGFHVDVLTDADERTIRRRVAAFFADRDPDDVLLLHFSCHGVKDGQGRLHLAARDTSLSSLSATAVPASFVNDRLTESRSRRMILVLDCCYSGAFGRGTVARAADAVYLNEEFGSGTGCVILTASSATEYSFEGQNLTRSDGQPSVFTSALVKGLATGEADSDGDGEISIDELYRYSHRAVRDRTPGQTPMMWSFGVEGSVVVARSVKHAPLPGHVQQDLASDRVELRLAGVNALAHLLRTGTPGVRESAIAALLGLGDDDSIRVRTAAAQALGGPPAAPPPPATHLPPQPVSPAQPVSPPPQTHLPPPPATATPGETNGLAVTALVLALVSLPLCYFGAVFAIPALIVANRATRRGTAGARMVRWARILSWITIGASGVALIVAMIVGIVDAAKNS
jgi:hypothetical protein